MAKKIALTKSRSSAKPNPSSRLRTGKSATRSSKSTKYVYYFGDGRADGDGKMKSLLGGKGANLAEMTRIGLPVPPAEIDGRCLDLDPGENTTCP